MKRHFAISSSEELLTRWKAARFPRNAPLTRCSGSPLAGTVDRILWLHQEHRDAGALAAEVERLRGVPRLPLVVLSLDPKQIDALHAFDAGAVGYCHALAVPDLLRQVAVVVANGGLWLGLN